MFWALYFLLLLTIPVYSQVNVQDFEPAVEQDIEFREGEGSQVSADGHVIGETGITYETQFELERRYQEELASYEMDPLEFNYGNIHGLFKVKYKPESFFGKNINQFNSLVDADKVIFSRHTIDANLILGYGRDAYCKDVAEFFMTLRQKVIWGNPGTSAQTLDQTVKLLDTVTGSHSHSITRQFPWIREIWFRFSIPEALSLSMEHDHYFSMGSFPFELGRGIALGSAYAVNPGLLGFYSDNTIDNYAYAFLFSGQLSKKKLWYDVYGAILENLSDTFRNTSLKVRGQEYGHLLNQQRGFGHVNFVIANRLKWIPVKHDQELVAVEPYILYNMAPEQTVEFLADSSSKLGTFGLACEFKHGKFEYGFDTAFNVGSQGVKGWDRNIIELSNNNGLQGVSNLNNGYMIQTNSKVHMSSPTGPQVPFIPANQKLIDSSTRSSYQNGKSIGFGVDSAGNAVELFNDINRFRDPYINKYKGKMIVTDFSYHVSKDVYFSGIFALATGDENPNKDLEDPNSSNVDGDFKGFLGLQEIYSGYRVKSAFLLGGAGRAPRPLSPALSGDVLAILPSSINGFTNLVFIGASADWEPTSYNLHGHLKPNILGYWQQHKSKKFDVITGLSSPNEYANSYLGTELNLFGDVEVFHNTHLFLVTSVFIPGKHYKDIKGLPLTRDQQKTLDKLDKTGLDVDKLPFLANDVAYTLNLGLEVKY